MAREHGLRIAFAADSHGHNYYLSGLAELSARTGAQPWGSASAELGYDHRPLKEREVIEFGDVGVEVLPTPGHTPAHVSLLVYDREAGADVPALMLPGGALLVGDLARPDLLGGPEQARRAAEEFCRTIQTTLLAPRPRRDHGARDEGAAGARRDRSARRAPTGGVAPGSRRASHSGASGSLLRRPRGRRGRG